MREGDVVLTAAPQADGAVKNRPAIVLREMPPFKDLLVWGISRQLGHEVKGFDEVITPRDSDFGISGLTSTSLLRLGFLAVVPLNRIIGRIGVVAPERFRRLRTKLSEFLAP